MAKHRHPRSLVVISVLLGLWSLFVFAVDGYFVRGFYGQWISSGFPTTTARVTRAKVKANASGGGAFSHHPELGYEYEVDGQVYEGATLRYLRVHAMRQEAAQEYLKQFPVGGDLEVHYDPDDPAVAIIAPGIAGGDLFLLLFLCPINIITIGCGLRVLHSWRSAKAPRYAGGVPVAHREDRTIFRFLQRTALHAGVLTGLVATFLSVFVLGIGMGTNPPLAHMQVVWACILLAIAVSAALRAWINRSGRLDLIVDKTQRTMTLPLTQGREESISFPFDLILDIKVNEVQIPARGGQPPSRYETLVVWRNGDEEVEEKLARWEEESQAQALVDALCREYQGTGSA